jgi:hypothetical protein
MLSELAECTKVMLKVIHEMYSTQRITYKEFVGHTEKKLQFLSENINSFDTENDRRDASDIIYKCSLILSEHEYPYLQ